MNILQALARMLTELFDDPDPNDKPVGTQVTGIRTNSPTVIEVTASSYAEAVRLIEGKTLAGNKNYSMVHAGRNKWEIREK